MVRGHWTMKQMTRFTGDLIGKLWTLPNSLVGIAYGLAGYLVGVLARSAPGIGLGNNAVQFRNCPLMASAMVFGNVIVYGRAPAFQPESPRGNHVLGDEERQHTYQAQWLGPLYLPAHLLSGISGLLLRRDWHGRGHACAFLECGPHSINPAPWPARSRSGAG
jgi:hypothetical protein